MVSCGIIICNTHFAVASACNALNNGWPKRSRYERYSVGSVIRRDRLTRLVTLVIELVAASVPRPTADVTCLISRTIFAGDLVLAFFYNRITIRFGSRCSRQKYRLNQMAKLETSIPGLTVRSSNVGHIMRQAFAGLIYVGISAAFASVVFVAWLISLVIW